jgi:hypothetical protein
VFSFHHRHTLSLTPELSRQFDRFLDLWERSLSDDLTPEDKAAVMARLKSQRDRLHTITDEPEVK